MRVNPIAVTMRVEGRPNLRWVQKVNVYPVFGALRACSHTTKFAADPNSEKFPAIVLTQARISHVFFSSLEIAAAEAATLAPSKRTTKHK